MLPIIGYGENLLFDNMIMISAYYQYKQTCDPTVYRTKCEHVIYCTINYLKVIYKAVYDCLLVTTLLRNIYTQYYYYFIISATSKC